MVANDVDGTGEVVIEGRTGRLVRPGDIESLEAKLVWARENLDQEREMAQEGKALCMDLFPAQRMVQELDRLYHSLLRNHQR